MLLIPIAAVLALASAAPPLPVGHTLSGRVTDSAGTALQHVRVVVLEASRSTETDGGGNYSIPNIPDGTWGISFSFVGYAPVVRRASLAGKDLELNVVLRQS